MIPLIFLLIFHIPFVSILSLFNNIRLLKEEVKLLYERGEWRFHQQEWFSIF